MTRDPEQFSTRRLQNIERLERQLASAPDDREGWLRLARVRLQQQRGTDALVAFEHGLWGLEPIVVAQGLLEAGWPWGDQEADEAEQLFGAALAGEDVTERLEAAEPRLRTRSAWLLWCQVGAPEQLVTVRARLLAGLPERGLAPRDLPAFVKDSEEFTTWSRGELERTIRG